MRTFSLKRKRCQLFVGLLLFSSSALCQNWETFVQKAKDSDPDLMSQKSKLEQKEAETIQARSGFFPNLSLNYNWQNNEVTTDSKKLSLQATQNLFKGFSDIHNFSKAQILEEAESHKISYQEKLTTQNISIAVLDWIYAAERTKILNEYISTLRQRDKELKRRSQIGKSRNVDVVQNQIRALEIERLIFENNQLLLTAQLKIKELTGIDNPTPTENLSSIAEKIKSNIDESDPYLDSQRKTTLAAEKAYQSTLSTYLPTVQLFANYYPVTDKNWATSSDKWAMGIQFQWVFFEGGSGKANRQKTFSLWTQAKSEEKKLMDSKTRFFSQWKNQITELEKQRSLAQQALVLSQKALGEQTKDFRLGLITILDLSTTDQQSLDLKLENLRIEAALAKEYAKAFTKEIL